MMRMTILKMKMKRLVCEAPVVAASRAASASKLCRAKKAMKTTHHR
jgi:hypothetical protein